MKYGNIKNIQKRTLSDQWYLLEKYTYEYQKEDGSWETQEREAYDRGNGACILLYDPKRRTVILTRQFRMPTYINGNERESGMMIEACAGLLDGDHPEDCIKKEAEEETGYRVKNVEKIMEAYTSPGAVTEIMHFFMAEYDASMRIGEGGGAADETENIEVLELTFDLAMEMIQNGKIKDAKTIILLQYAAIHKF